VLRAVICAAPLDLSRGSAARRVLRLSKATFLIGRKIMIVEIKARGLTPILCNRMSESVLEGLRTKVKKPKTADIGHVRTPREDCEEKVYLHGKKPIIPGENLMSALIAGGVFVRLDQKRQLSTGKSTVLPGLMTLLDAVLYLVDPDDEKQPAKWEPDIRKGTNPNGNEAVCIVRPRFDRWAFVTKIDVDTQAIGENAIRNLWDLTGRRIGLGDYRPARKGIFGQFVVEKWDRVEERTAAE
jgi:hypothetical protein